MPKATASAPIVRHRAVTRRRRASLGPSSTCRSGGVDAGHARTSEVPRRRLGRRSSCFGGRDRTRTADLRWLVRPRLRERRSSARVAPAERDGRFATQVVTTTRSAPQDAPAVEHRHHDVEDHVGVARARPAVAVHDRCPRPPARAAAAGCRVVVDDRTGRPWTAVGRSTRRSRRPVPRCAAVERAGRRRRRPPPCRCRG